MPKGYNHPFFPIALILTTLCALTTPAQEAIIVDFPDKNLEAAIRKLDPKSFRIPVKNAAVVRKADAQVKRDLLTTARPLEPFRENACVWVTAALSLLNDADLREKALPGDESMARLERCLCALKAIGEVHKQVIEMTPSLLAIRTLLLNQKRVSKTYKQELDERVAEQHRSIQQVCDALGQTSYPFAHADGAVSLAEHVLDTLPDVRDPASVAQATQDLSNNFFVLYFRLLGYLASVAERVEETIGGPATEPPPLPEMNVPSIAT